MDDNTEREQQARWANIPVVSLHVDLVETGLEDFAEHFENRLLQAVNQVELLGGYLDDPLLGNLEGYTLLWNEDPEDDESPAPGVAWKDLKPGKYLRITSTHSGATRISYLVDEWTEDPLKSDNPASVRLILFATRYRRDRLKIVVFEERYAPTQYAPHLKTWLLERWGEDGVDEKTFESTPMDTALLPGKPGRPRDPWNQKAIDRLLAGDNPKQVRKEWRAEFEAAIKMNLDQTSDGEEKTWQRRVWEPYSLRAKRAK